MRDAGIGEFIVHAAVVYLVLFVLLPFSFAVWKTTARSPLMSIDSVERQIAPSATLTDNVSTLVRTVSINVRGKPSTGPCTALPFLLMLPAPCSRGRAGTILHEIIRCWIWRSSMQLSRPLRTCGARRVLPGEVCDAKWGVIRRAGSLGTGVAAF